MATSGPASATVIRTVTSTTGDNFDGGSYTRVGTGSPTNRYLFNMNHWNPSSNGQVTVDVETDPAVAPGFDITEWTDTAAAGGTLDFTRSASVYDTGSKTWSDVEGQSDTGSGHFHAPAAYTSLYKGCHWGDCTSGQGGPYPIRVDQVAGLQSTFDIADVTGTEADTGVWNASFDIWYDTNARGYLPGSPTALQWEPTDNQRGQNDGTEIMYWCDNRGYDSTITPAGELAGQVTLSVGGVNRSFDYWIGRLQAVQAPDQPPPPPWNVVSYVETSGPGCVGSFDAKVFQDHAATLTCPSGDACIRPEWYITSVQAGFEVWADGVGLGVDDFANVPTFTTAPGASVNSGRQGDGGIPLVHWEVPSQLRTVGCPGGVATYQLALYGETTGGAPLKYVPATPAAMTEAQPGVYVAILPALKPEHGYADVIFTIDCPGTTPDTTTTVSIYIDPSGRVITTYGTGITEATVALYRSDSATGPFSLVPDGSDLMAPYNRSNPDLTGADGAFGWDVQAGYYFVRAAKEGCHAPGNGDQPFVDTAVLTIPPAVTDLELEMECPGAFPGPGTGTVDLPPEAGGPIGGGPGPGGGTPVGRLHTFSENWPYNYCATIEITNTTSQPLTWSFSFDLVGRMYTSWNMNLTQSGQRITARGVGWNSVLPPGGKLTSTGFCANY